MSILIDDLRVETSGSVLYLTFSRPQQRNAFTLSMGAHLERLMTEINDRPDVRAVVFRGEGQSFSAGGDFGFIEERAQSPAEKNREAMLGFYRLFLSVRKLRVPTVAAMHGSAVGAGLCLALACDLRLAAEGTQLSFNFVRIGLHPGMGATYFLPRLVGPGKAAELLLTGKMISAEEALRIGLVNEVCPQDQLAARAQQLAEEIARAAPIAVAQTKASLRQSAELSLEQCLEVEALAQAIDYGTEDLAEAIRAFREKRRPSFSGR